MHDERDPAATRKPFLWLVLGLAVVAVIVIGIVVVNLSGGDDESTPVAETTAPSEEPSKKATKKTPKADPPKIENVESLDPEGDGSEHDSEVENVIPKTEGSWNTDRYNSASFGNLKSGVGLLFEFEDETTISKAKVASGNSGGKFEIRDGDDPEDAKVIGEGVFDAEGAVTVEFDEEVETDKLILWITDLPQTDGRQWQELLAGDQLHLLAERPVAGADRFVYGVRCDDAGVDLSIAEPELPHPVQQLFLRTLGE